MDGFLRAGVAALALFLSGCATAPPAKTGIRLPLRLVGDAGEWSGMLRNARVEVEGPSGRILVDKAEHFSAGRNSILLNSTLAGSEQVTVLIEETVCRIAGKTYPYSSYVGVRVDTQTSYTLKGCARSA